MHFKIMMKFEAFCVFGHCKYLCGKIFRFGDRKDGVQKNF